MCNWDFKDNNHKPIYCKLSFYTTILSVYLSFLLPVSFPSIPDGLQEGELVGIAIYYSLFPSY